MNYSPPPAGPVVMPHFTTMSWFSVLTSTGARIVDQGFDQNGLPWPANNRAIYIPMHIPETITVVKMFRHIGNNAGGNWDVGIYDDSFTRIVSTGSTAAGSVNTVQVFDITDTLLVGGRLYYIASACDSTSGRTMANPSQADLNIFKQNGVMQEASAFPLPSTATPVIATTDFYPIIGCSLRTLVT